MRLVYEILRSIVSCRLNIAVDGLADNSGFCVSTQFLAKNAGNDLPNYCEKSMNECLLVVYWRTDAFC